MRELQLCKYFITSHTNVNINEANSVTKTQILSFSDQNPGWDYHVPASPDATFGQADTNDDSLQNFFSRPIKVASYDWGTGVNLFQTFNPWKAFWENPRIINRITNYNLLRCKLCVKFVLNGNGFHYGRAIASYLPLHTADGFTKDRAFFIEDIVEASQRPHIYLDPTNSQGGTMCLPFVWRQNALDIPEAEWDDMGDIIIHGMQSLKHANGATDSVTVSIFAWAEDVVMSTPTANEPGALVAQAGPVDEYGTGIISTPASIIARAAGALSNAPVIGLYAKATQIGASAIASIAKTFGYSRPNNLSEIQPYRPTFVGNMANTNYPDSAVKLTYDAKQELTCDTRTFGLDGTDEMTIKSIATRESYLTKFGWAISDTTESRLWNTEVSPVSWAQLNVGGKQEFHMPACCFAALPFRHWRGTMKYRFQIVASSFHKGRLKITYDPSYPLTNEYNTNYTRIVDLAEERDFTIEIGWGQQFPFCKHRDMFTNVTEVYSESALAADPKEFANGILSVYCVNELTTPNSTVTNDIEVNVFISAGDDFEVADPDVTGISQLSWYAPQCGPLEIQGGIISKIPCPNFICNSHCCSVEEDDVEVLESQAGELGESPEGDNTAQESAPVRTVVDESVAPTLSETDHTMDVFFGDPVTSIRQLLKRYNFSRFIPILSDVNGTFLVDQSLNNLPLYYGFAPDGVDLAVDAVLAAQPFNFVQVTLLNYFMPAYTCQRGGIKWKYHYLTDTGSAANNLAVNFMTANRRSDRTTYDQDLQAVPVNLATSSGDQAASYLFSLTSLQTGGHSTAVERNPVLEVEIPYFENRRFNYAKQSGLNTATDSRAAFHQLLTKAIVTNTSSSGILSYVAVGEDFTLGFYTGPPVAYRQLLPTPS